jgi:hypothetical protein
MGPTQSGRDVPPVACAISCDRFSQFRQTVRIKEDANVALVIGNDDLPANMFRQRGPGNVQSPRNYRSTDNSFRFADFRHATVAMLSTLRVAEPRKGFFADCSFR